MAVRIDGDVSGRVQAPPRSIEPRIRNGRVRPHVRSTLPKRHRDAVRSGGRAAMVVPRWMYRGYQDVNAGDLAAAIAYNALVALAPTILLFLSIASLLLRNDDIFLNTVLASFWAFNQDVRKDTINTALAIRNNGPLLAGLTFISFFWIGSGFVSALARGMNRIYGVRNRSFVRERIRGFVIIVAFAVLSLLASIPSAAATLFFRRDLNYFFDTWHIADTSYQLLSYGLSLVAATALFLVLYRAVPNAGQKLRDVWPGALTAAVLFVVVAQVFPIYFRLVGGANRYGAAFGFVTLLVSSFYVLAHVILFGTYVNATYQRHCRLKQSVAGHTLPGCG